jgi:hypothetical protein
MRFGRSAWCATQSQELIERPRFTAAMLFLSLFGEATEFLRVAREFLFPGGFVPQGFHDLRGDGVLFVLGKRGKLAQRVFEQCGHKTKCNKKSLGWQGLGGWSTNRPNAHC